MTFIIFVIVTIVFVGRLFHKIFNENVNYVRSRFFSIFEAINTLLIFFGFGLGFEITNSVFMHFEILSCLLNMIGALAQDFCLVFYKKTASSFNHISIYKKKFVYGAVLPTFIPFQPSGQLSRLYAPSIILAVNLFTDVYVKSAKFKMFLFLHI